MQNVQFKRDTFLQETEGTENNISNENKRKQRRQENQDNIVCTQTPYGSSLASRHITWLADRLTCAQALLCIQTEIITPIIRKRCLLQRLENGKDYWNNKLLSKRTWYQHKPTWKLNTTDNQSIKRRHQKLVSWIVWKKNHCNSTKHINHSNKNQLSWKWRSHHNFDQRHLS